MVWYLGPMEIVPRNYALVVNMFLWTSFAFIAITLRLYTRVFIVKRVGLDDWLMAGAMVFSISFAVTVCYQIKWGLGQPVNLATLIPFLGALFATVPLYNCTQTLYKLSITTQSYRLFTTTAGKRSLQLLIVWICMCSVMTISGSLFYCLPVPKAWDDSVVGHCVDRSALNYAVSGFNIVNDLTLLFIPVPFLLKLQIQQKQKVVLLSVFACGAIVTVISIIRLKALYINLNSAIELQPVTGVDIALWSGVEINAAIICGSVPALKALISRILGATHVGSSSDGYASRTGGNTKLTFGSRNDDLDSKGGGIRLQQDIEMKPYNKDDDNDSERNLIIMGNAESFVSGRRVGNQTTITGNTKL